MGRAASHNQHVSFASLRTGSHSECRCGGTHSILLDMLKEYERRYIPCEETVVTPEGYVYLVSSRDVRCGRPFETDFALVSPEKHISDHVYIWSYVVERL